MHHSDDLHLQQIADSCSSTLFQYTVRLNGTEVSAEFTYLSKSIEKLFPGISCSEIYKNPQLLLNPVMPESRQRVVQAFRNSFYNSEPLDIHFTISIGHNEIRWISAKANVSTDDTGQNFLNGTFQDITEWIKRDEKYKESLRLSRQQYQSMIDEVEDYVILLLDNNGNFLNWNKGAKNLKGYDRTEVMGKNMEIFYTDEDRKSGKPQNLLQQAIRKGKSSDEGWRVKKDKSLFWASVVITALHDPNGKVSGFTKVTRDKTKEKEYLNAIESQNQALRSIAFMQSHVVRAPLSRILGVCNLVASFDLDKEELTEFIKALKQSATELDDLVHETAEKINNIDLDANKFLSGE